MSSKFNKTLLIEAEANLNIANEIYKDLAGFSRDGLTVNVFGDFLTVCDGQDRWLAEVEDFQSALDTVLESALKGDYAQTARERGSEPYDDLCRDCPAMYSRIGVGEYNNKTGELVKLLNERQTQHVDAILEYLGIEIEESEEVEA